MSQVLLFVSLDEFITSLLNWEVPSSSAAPNGIHPWIRRDQPGPPRQRQTNGFRSIFGLRPHEEGRGDESIRLRSLRNENEHRREQAIDKGSDR
jgi:hypothetical protein